MNNKTYNSTYNKSKSTETQRDKCKCNKIKFKRDILNLMNWLNRYYHKSELDLWMIELDLLKTSCGSGLNYRETKNNCFQRDIAREMRERREREREERGERDNSYI